MFGVELHEDGTALVTVTDGKAVGEIAAKLLKAGGAKTVTGVSTGKAFLTTRDTLVKAGLFDEGGKKPVKRSPSRRKGQ